MIKSLASLVLSASLIIPSVAVARSMDPSLDSNGRASVKAKAPAKMTPDSKKKAASAKKAPAKKEAEKKATAKKAAAKKLTPVEKKTAELKAKKAAGKKLNPAEKKFLVDQEKATAAKKLVEDKRKAAAAQQKLVEDQKTAAAAQQKLIEDQKTAAAAQQKLTDDKMKADAEAARLATAAAAKAAADAETARQAAAAASAKVIADTEAEKLNRESIDTLVKQQFSKATDPQREAILKSLLEASDILDAVYPMLDSEEEQKEAVIDALKVIPLPEAYRTHQINLVKQGPFTQYEEKPNGELTGVSVFEKTSQNVGKLLNDIANNDLKPSVLKMQPMDVIAEQFSNATDAQKAVMIANLKDAVSVLNRASDQGGKQRLDAVINLFKTAPLPESYRENYINEKLNTLRPREATLWEEEKDRTTYLSVINKINSFLKKHKAI